MGFCHPCALSDLNQVRLDPFIMLVVFMHYFDLFLIILQQEHLYQELQSVCESNMITEENLSRLPYLCAVFHETLRLHSPVPIIPLRYVHEDTQIGGYYIPAGSEVVYSQSIYVFFFFLIIIKVSL